MKKLGNAVLLLDIPLNVVGFILCLWRINIMLHSDLQKIINEGSMNIITILLQKLISR